MMRGREEAANDVEDHGCGQVKILLVSNKNPTRKEFRDRKDSWLFLGL